MRDVEVPLFLLEQRTEKLEATLASFQLEMVAKLTESVCSKLNTDMTTYLPKVKMGLDDLRLLKESTTLRFESLERNASQDNTIDTEKVKDL